MAKVTSPFEENLSSLQRLETALPGVIELRPKMIRDARGFFLETYNSKRFAELGIADHFVQDNHSCSRKGALRGLHYRLRRPQSKLCRVIEGEALDVAVDIRLGFLNFGKWTSVLLSTREQNQVYLPVGFAHGFLALTDTVQFLYKCSDFYDPADEHGIVRNDPDLKILWGIDAPILSEKDKKYPTLGAVPGEFLPGHPAE